MTEQTCQDLATTDQNAALTKLTGRGQGKGTGGPRSRDMALCSVRLNGRATEHTEHYNPLRLYSIHSSQALSLPLVVNFVY
jgi:hypothetical protein